MNTMAFNPYVAFVGIDWADTKHDVCIQAANNSRREFAVVPHTVEEIDAWAQSLHKRFSGQIAVAIELTKGPIVYALQKYDYFVIFPINAVTLAKYREAFQPSGAKDDPTDAELALDLICRHLERFEPLQPQSVEIRALAALVEHRRRLVDDRVRLTNRLRNTLKQCYPQALEWFDRIDTLLFCDFIERWPTLARVERARRSTLETFFRGSKHKVLERRLVSIASSQHLTLDEAVIAPNKLNALMLIDMLRVMLNAIKTYEKAIADLAPRHDDYDFLVPCLVQDHHLHLVYWLPLVNREIASRQLQSCRNTLGWHR